MWVHLLHERIQRGCEAIMMNSKLGNFVHRHFFIGNMGHYGETICWKHQFCGFLRTNSLILLSTGWIKRLLCHALWIYMTISFKNIRLISFQRIDMLFLSRNEIWMLLILASMKSENCPAMSSDRNFNARSMNVTLETSKAKELR